MLRERARRLVSALTFAFMAGETETVLELDRELRQLTDDPAVLGQAALWVAQVQVLKGVGRTSVVRCRSPRSSPFCPRSGYRDRPAGGCSRLRVPGR